MVAECFAALIVFLLVVIYLVCKCKENRKAYTELMTGLSSGEIGNTLPHRKSAQEMRQEINRWNEIDFARKCAHNYPENPSKPCASNED